MVEDYWTDDKSRTDIETIKTFVFIKYNWEFTCSEFHDNLKKNARLLKGVGGKEKYDKTQATPSNNAVEAIEIDQ